MSAKSRRTVPTRLLQSAKNQQACSRKNPNSIGSSNDKQCHACVGRCHGKNVIATEVVGRWDEPKAQKVTKLESLTRVGTLYERHTQMRLIKTRLQKKIGKGAYRSWKRSPETIVGGNKIYS
jgi:hypothetical protein